MAAAIIVAGCGDEEPAEPVPQTPLARALADVGGGGEHGSLGFGWVEPRLVEGGGQRGALIAAALGPNAGSFAERAGALRRRFGFDPLAAERLISIGGSYAYGVRIEGEDGARLARALVAAGGRSHRAGETKLVEVGDYAVVPRPLLDVGIRGLGAFDAFAADLAVLAISDRARSALLGEGDRLLDEPVYAAAAECLGEVAAARMIPDKHLLATDLGIDLVAVGISAESEALCLTGADPERAGEIAAALERGLGPGGSEPDSGEPIARSLGSIEISRDRIRGVEVVRAEGTTAPSARPSFFLGAIARGSIVGLVNGSTETFLR